MKTARSISNFYALGYALAHPSLMRKALRMLARQRYESKSLGESALETKTIGEVFDFSKPFQLQNCCSRGGNVSPFELMVIASAIVNYQPVRLLEIGTFDGNTTLQMALNAPLNAIVHTIDLPDGDSVTQIPIEKNDQKFIRDTTKHHRKFKETSVASKIAQHFGDTTVYDFQHFAKDGPIDFCFVDGGHSYACVKSDTENALRILSPNGIILWHDFNYKSYPGVFDYLCELSKSYPLIHIEGTHLVVLKKS